MNGIDIFHHLSGDDVLERLRTSATGLTSAQARERLTMHGPNAIAEGHRRSVLAIFSSQFTDFMIVVLLVAAAISGLIGDLEDTVSIVAIVLLNAAVGFVQEYRAERAMEALKAMAAPTATALRDGTPCLVPAIELVPGDVVLFDAGRVVPADLRLLEAVSLRTDEAALTGESVPVEKTTEPLPTGDLALGDRTNMAFKGTTVAYGRGTGVVVATGMDTQLGRIAAGLAEADEATTPLQRRLAEFGRRLALVILAICAVVFAAGLWRGEAPLLMFMTAVSLAVAAIPEALPAVITVSLALGARKMIRQRALIRKLPAVESLGSVTVICSDKTGTLTVSRMSSEAFHCDGVQTPALGSGAPWDDLVRAMILDNDAAVDAETCVGDSMEVALVQAAARVRDPVVTRRDYPRVAEIPFDPVRRCMTTVHPDGHGGFVAFTKGASEALLAQASTIATSAGVQPLDVGAVTALTERMAADGLRVLAFGVRHWSECPSPVVPETVERDLTLLGLVGLMDPPREEAREAVATCRRAGIVPVMITGDHPATARAIARRLAILEDGAGVMTGTELAKLSSAELEAVVLSTRVYARVAPEQKLRIVRALQARGEIVAMTGDGVNDAPALKQADIGVAMGITGTDVSKEASGMILLDDNFATIVAAVREGRRIFDNLRRFIRYAVTTNAAEVWLILVAPFLGLPMPLVPIQILWINLVSDGFPGLALAAEPEEKDVMRRPPRPPRESILARGLGWHAVWVSILMAGLCIGVEAWGTWVGTTAWQTMVFTALGLAQLAHVLAIRSERESLFTQGLLSNIPLTTTVLATLGLQLAAIYLPPMNDFLKTEPLRGVELGVAIGAACAVFVAVEIEKWWGRRKEYSGAP